MRTILRNLIRRFVPQTDREAGFTLLELIVAIASFTIICAGLTTLLITALRIEKYTADNTQYRETVRMVRAYVRDQAGNGKIETDSDKLTIGGATILECVVDPEHSGKYALRAGGSTVADRLEEEAQFEINGQLLTFNLKMGETEYPVSIYCPLN